MTGQVSRALSAATTVIYTVNRMHDHERWSAEVTAYFTSAEGDTVDLGSVRREFGPFDDSTTVAQWLCQQAHSQTKLQAAGGSPPPQDPPQGRRLPDSK